MPNSDNATSKNAIGLDSPHVVDIGSPVVRTFSSSSSLHMFVLSHDGKLFGMGKNDHGQLGLGDIITKHSPSEIKMPWGKTKLLKISTGRSHTLFLLSNGDLYGCGSNSCGQLGLGSGIRAQQDSLNIVKLSLSGVRDIACGQDHSIACDAAGRVWAFGHPQYGQLGLGVTGESLQEGKRGLQFNYVCAPEMITRFSGADGRSVVRADEVVIRAVYAGKNHSVAVENWVDDNGEDKVTNRVFSWGFGGYGRLGHNGANDELVPREIATFTTDRVYPQKQIREIYCGSSYTLAISKSRHLYFCGILPNSPRGEACTYPRIQQELYAWSTHLATGGTSWVIAAADDACVFWGVPVAGKFGLDGDARSSSAPTFVTAVSDFRVCDVTCGYGHVAMVVCAKEGATRDVSSFKLLSDAVDAQSCYTPTTTAVSQGKKRGAPKKAETAAAARKKGKK